MLCDGPCGDIKYLGKGIFEIKDKILSQKKIIGLIADGAGVLSMYSIAYASLYANEDIKIIFLNINKTISDIFFQKELDELASKFKKNFTLFNCLSNHNDNSDG